MDWTYHDGSKFLLPASPASLRKEIILDIASNSKIKWAFEFDSFGMHSFTNFKNCRQKFIQILDFHQS